MQRVILLAVTLVFRLQVLKATDTVPEQEAAGRACNGGFVVDASSVRSGVIASPLVQVQLYGRSRQTYASNLNCEWVIVKPENSVIEIWFSYVDIHLSDGCEYPNGGDAVSLLEGNKVREVFCWSRTPDAGKRYKFKTNSNVTVKFRSDVVETARGFELNWRKFDTCEPESYACSKHADCWIKNPRRNINRCECKPGYFGDGIDCTEDVDLQACDVPGGYFVNGTASSEGAVTSPRFPRNYQNSLNCKWTIVLPENHSIHLNVDHLEISQGSRWQSSDGNSGYACWGDHVTLYDGDRKVGEFCGGEWCGGPACAAPFWNEHVFTSSKITFVFETDERKVHQGFRFSWTKIAVCDPEENRCSSDAKCWIKNQEVECACKEGFVDVHGNGSACEFSVEEKSCLDGYTFPGTSGVITSPNFPDNYPAYKHCKWFIPNPSNKIVQIRVETFELQFLWDEAYCDAKDYMELFDGIKRLDRYCEIRRPPHEVVLSSGEDVTVVFHSDTYGTNRGMKLNWWLVEACEPERFGCSHRSTCWIRDSGHVCSCGEGYSGDGIDCEVYKSRVAIEEMACGGGVVLSEPSGNITSPGFPLPYSTNLNCEWSIVQPNGTAIRLTFEKFDLEEHQSCKFDYVQVMDGHKIVGKHCGRNQSLAFTSSTDTVTLTFVSDNSVPSTGFLISWSSA